jgi:RNA polymerase sigma factor (sigma-70 family)
LPEAQQAIGTKWIVPHATVMKTLRACVFLMKTILSEKKSGGLTSISIQCEIRHPVGKSAYSVMGSGQVKDEEFEILLNRFADFIRVHIQKYNPHKYGLDPDDISQDVRIKIWKVLNTEKNITNYSSYIKKIVNSSVIDQLRKLRREEGIFNHEKQVAERELAYSIELSRFRALEETVGKAVDSLIETRRQVVKLYLLNLSIQEIAGYLNWSTDKTRNLLYRGLSDLKKILKTMDVHYEPKR